MAVGAKGSARKTGCAGYFLLFRRPEINGCKSKLPLLAAEFIAVQTACPQVSPQFCFRLAHFFAHGFGALMQGGVVGSQ